MRQKKDKQRRRQIRKRKLIKKSKPREPKQLHRNVNHELHSQPKEVFSRLSKYDPADLLSTIGALQLMPENADRNVRLGAYAHIIACSQVQANRPIISYSELREILEEDIIGNMFGRMEDPTEHLFTHEFTFDGGGYITFPGIMADAPFILSNICKAIFFHPISLPNEQFKIWARRIINVLLTISDKIAVRAGLSRGIEPISRPGRGIFVPNEEQLAHLKKSVRFKEAELRSLFEIIGLSGEQLNQLSVPIGTPRLDPQAALESPLMTRPFVKLNGDIVCPSPSNILPTILSQVAGSAIQNDLKEPFCCRYSDAVWHSVTESLGYLGHSPLPTSSLPPLDIPLVKEGVFTLDSDKLLYTLLIVDNLQDFKGLGPDDFFDAQGIYSKIEQEMPTRIRHILTMHPRLNNILCLIVTGGLARASTVGLTGKGWESVPKLMLSAEALANISLDGGGNPLELWDFATDLASLYDRCKVIQTSHLDMFEYYRSQGHTFYGTDDARPALMSFFPGFGGELRRRVLKERGLHAATSYKDGLVVEVTSLHSGDDVPIYCPLSDIGRRISLLVEGIHLPIWVLGPDKQESIKGHKHSTYAQLVDAVAYWLWQFTPTIQDAFRLLSSELEMCKVFIELPPKDLWDARDSVNITTGTANVIADADAGAVHVSIQPALSDMLSGPKNGGERSLMTEILRGFRDLLPANQQDLLSEDVISACMELHAPLGEKKKFFTIDASQNPQLCPVDFPYRKLSEAAENRVTDEIGCFLTSEKGMKVGKFGDSKRQVAVINDIVTWLYNRLRRQVATLRPEGLLEWLIAYQEAVAHETAENRLHATTTPACFGNEPRMLEILAERLPELANARMANRFLIEYVAACPPNGLRQISLTAHDQLLALAISIINLGSISDLLRYDIVDMEYEILPSGRLGRNVEAYEGPRDLYVQTYTFGQLARAKGSFHRYWRETSKPAAQGEKAENLVDAATQAEWGISVSEVLSLLLMTPVFSSLEEGRGAMCEEEEQTIERLVRELGWPKARVEFALNLLALDTRRDFLNPAAPHSREDVYPWRLDRELSYLRRPLVRRRHAGRTELLWGFRHMDQACEYYSSWTTSGRLRGESMEVVALNTEINARKGKAFNEAVTKVLESDGDLVVRANVKKVGKLRTPGDIDVLAVDPTRRGIVVIECKDLEAARTPHELNTELLKLFKGSETKKSLIQKHLARVKWVRDHIDDVLSAVGIGESGGQWNVHEMMVTNSEMLSPFIRECPAKVVSFEQLKSAGIACALSPQTPFVKEGK